MIEKDGVKPTKKRNPVKKGEKKNISRKKTTPVKPFKESEKKRMTRIFRKTPGNAGISEQEFIQAIAAMLKSETKIPAKGPYTVTLSISKKTSTNVKVLPKTLTFEL